MRSSGTPEQVPLPTKVYVPAAKTSPTTTALPFAVQLDANIAVKIPFPLNSTGEAALITNVRLALPEPEKATVPISPMKASYPDAWNALQLPVPDEGGIDPEAELTVENIRFGVGLAEAIEQDMSAAPAAK
jgi:hypothetical protein